METILILLTILLTEILTIKIRNRVTDYFALEEILIIHKKGFKIDLKILSDYTLKLKNKKYTRNELIISRLVDLLPFVNILKATINGLKNVNSIMKDETIKQGLEPMTDREKEEFKQLKTNDLKMNYLSFLYKNEYEYVDNKISYVDALRVKKEKLLPLAYTYEELTKLIEVAEYDKMIGKIDGANVAVIGIPKLSKEYNKIIFTKEDNKVHPFSSYREEEAKDKTYLVYPYTEECEIKVQKTINEIIQQRFKNERPETEYHPFDICNETPKIKHHVIK